MRLAAVLIAASVALSGCSPGRVPFTGDPARAQAVGLSGTAPERAALTDLYRRALLADERTVVVYSCTGPSEWEPLWTAFAQTFPGLTVTYSHISPSQVLSRIDAETATGRHFGDVYITPVHIAEAAAAKGYFQPYAPATLGALEARYRGAGDRVHYPLSKVFGLAYNPTTTLAAELPRGIDDVLSPRWKQRFSYIKPATVNGTTDAAIANLRHDGAVTRAQLQGLRDNGAYGGIEAGVTYVSQGRQDLQLWAYLPTVVRQSALGAPVKIVFPPDFSTLVPFGVAISRNAVRPNAARLFEAWLFTPQAQALLARKVGMYGTMPGAPTPPFLSEADARAIRDELTPAQLRLAIADQQPELKAIFNAPLRR